MNQYSQNVKLTLKSIKHLVQNTHTLVLQEYETVGILLLEFYWFIWMSSSQRTARNFLKLVKKIQNLCYHKYHNNQQTEGCLPDMHLHESLLLTKDHPLLSNLLNKPKPGQRSSSWYIKCAAGRTTWCSMCWKIEAGPGGIHI